MSSIKNGNEAKSVHTAGRERLKLAAIILIVVGLTEIITIALAIAFGFSFGGASLLYVWFGYRLLKNDLTAYRNTTWILTAIAVFLVTGALVLGAVVLQVMMTEGMSTRLSPGPLPVLLTVGYGLVFATLAVQLFHPDTRRHLNLDVAGRRPWTLYFTNRRVFGVVAGAAVLSGVIMGPHLFTNPMRAIAAAIRQNSQVQKDLGTVDRIVLLQTGTFNWTVRTRVEVTAARNKGFYYANLSPDGVVHLDAYDFTRMPDLVPVSDRQPAVEEYDATATKTDSDVVLLSTSFEREDEGKKILPLHQDGKLAWARQAAPHSGRFAINAIPAGNPGNSSYFAEPVSVVKLSSRLSGEYTSFDVTDIDEVSLEFWRYSTSNPSETHNCLASLRVDYRLDAAEWESRMVYCGRHKSRAKNWTRAELSFDTSNSDELEIRFEYEYPPSSKKDRTAMYLIDDLLVRGTKSVARP